MSDAARSGRLAGERYERWKAGRRLEAQGYQVDHRSGNGQPDIIATDPNGRVSVYSCKALYLYRRTTVSLGEIMPELREAVDRHADLVLSVFDLKAGTELPDMIIPTNHLPKAITVLPQTP